MVMVIEFSFRCWKIRRSFCYNYETDQKVEQRELSLQVIHIRWPFKNVWLYGHDKLSYDVYCMVKGYMNNNISPRSNWLSHLCETKDTELSVERFPFPPLSRSFIIIVAAAVYIPVNKLIAPKMLHPLHLAMNRWWVHPPFSYRFFYQYKNEFFLYFRSFQIMLLV